MGIRIFLRAMIVSLVSFELHASQSVWKFDALSIFVASEDERDVRSVFWWDVLSILELRDTLLDPVFI